MSSQISSNSRVLVCSEATAPFGRRTFVIQSVVLQSQVITHIWPAKRSIKTARCNESPALQHGAVQRKPAGLSNTPKDLVESRPRVQQQANWKVPLSTGLLDETVKLEQTSAFRIARQWIVNTSHRLRHKPCAPKHAGFFFFGQRSQKNLAARTSRETASGERLNRCGRGLRPVRGVSAMASGEARRNTAAADTKGRNVAA